MINADNIGLYVSNLEAKVIKLEKAQEGSISLERFYAVKMDIPEVARLHNVDPRTVRGYVKRGLIEIHPDSTDSHTYLRGSVALSLDFRKLRKCKL
jgi:hypothetical protein